MRSERPAVTIRPPCAGPAASSPFPSKRLSSGCIGGGGMMGEDGFGGFGFPMRGEWATLPEPYRTNGPRH